jgi:hypothetical protein
LKIAEGQKKIKVSIINGLASSPPRYYPKNGGKFALKNAKI